MIANNFARWLTDHHDETLVSHIRAIRARHGRWMAWLVPAIYMGCLAAFVSDLQSANTLAFGVLYTPLVATAVFHEHRHAVWWLTALALAMVLIGSFLPHIAHDVRQLVANRVLSAAAILATAVLVWRARIVQDQLAAQTVRAEAAERIAHEVLTTVSHEIRAPLYAMIGVLDLASAESPPGQRAALGMVRASGRRLVTTVDNLVDLTQLDTRSVAPEPVDLAPIVYQTVGALRPDAANRQIGLSLEFLGEVKALADPWAVRRIVENLIDDAIVWSVPGGAIQVTARTLADRVILIIADRGRRPPGTVPFNGDTDIARLAPSVMGQVLSQRLARAMGAALAFQDGLSGGLNALLSFPAADADDDRDQASR